MDTVALEECRAHGAEVCGRNRSSQVESWHAQFAYRHYRDKLVVGNPSDAIVPSQLLFSYRWGVQGIGSRRDNPSQARLARCRHSLSRAGKVNVENGLMLRHHWRDRHRHAGLVEGHSQPLDILMQKPLHALHQLTRFLGANFGGEGFE